MAKYPSYMRSIVGSSPTAPTMLKIIPLELSDANSLVKRWHRHHKEVQGHRFSIGVMDDKTGKVVGAAVVGRPVARRINYRTTLEVTRLVTDGTKNACSILYAACARIGREMGYQKIQTYILDNETGVSLKAASWFCEEEIAGGGQWRHTDGKPRRTDQPISPKQRWCKIINSPAEIETISHDGETNPQLTFNEHLC